MRPFRAVTASGRNATHGGPANGILLHFDGANLSTTFTDETGKTWSAVSGAKISTAQSKFGGSSLLLNGSSDFIDSVSHADFGFGTGDFTIECFVYQGTQTGDQGLFNTTTGTGGISFGLQNGKAFCGPGGVSYGPIASSAITSNVWTHVAATRQGTTMRVFHGGTQMASATDTVNYAPRIANIGATSLNDNVLVSGYFNGYIDEFRVTKGTALYTGNFTPPSSPFT